VATTAATASAMTFVFGTLSISGGIPRSVSLVRGRFERVDPQRGR
jgi:hypothetical protein